MEIIYVYNIQAIAYFAHLRHNCNIYNSFRR
nr:MAG TPA: hypothetical protein [Caudoviricetes sp.]